MDSLDYDIKKVRKALNYRPMKNKLAIALIYLGCLIIAVFTFLDKIRMDNLEAELEKQKSQHDEYLRIQTGMRDELSHLNKLIRKDLLKEK